MSNITEEVQHLSNRNSTEKRQCFQKRELEQINMQKKKNLDKDLTRFTKTDPKLIIDLNLKHKTIKLLEDNMGEKSW